MRLNRFLFTTSKNSSKPDRVLIEVTPESEADWMQTLKKHYEIPIMQGSRKVLKSGMVKYVFELPQDEASLLRQALLQAYSKQSGYQTSN